jgi:hypothetical protein
MIALLHRATALPWLFGLLGRDGLSEEGQVGRASAIHDHSAAGEHAQRDAIPEGDIAGYYGRPVLER